MIIIRGLIVLGENKCFEDPMDKDKFKEMVVKGEFNIDRSDVNGWLKRKPANNLFEINGGIKSKYPVKEVWT